VYALVAFGLALLLMVQHYQVAAFISLGALVPLLVAHRGMCHSPYFAGAVIASVGYVGVLVWPRMAHRIIYDALFFMVGVISHILLDGQWRRLLPL